jgi:ISXO2-like transposase domain
MLERVDPKSGLTTDEATPYRRIGRQFASHESVNHKDKEWVRGLAHVNTAEGFFSICKRGMVGIYRHCSEKHLHRYLAEYDFLYSNRARLGVDDTERTRRVLRGAEGKRLTYRRTRSQTGAAPTT